MSRTSALRPLGLRLVVALAAVVGLLAVPVGALAQSALEARGIDRVCPPPEDRIDGQVPEFPDAGEAHGDAIRCATQYRIVAGFEDGTFRPGQPVTRGQLATLLARWLRAATGFALPVPEDVPFSDTAGTTHADAIHALAAIGVVNGRGDGTYGPGEPLNRGQLAQTVVRAISVADVLEIDGPLPPEAGDVTFGDVADDTLFAPAILSLAEVGVVQGDTDGDYHPDRTVTRGQLATFLMRSADYLDRYQRWKPTAEVEVLLVRLRAEHVVTDDDPEGDDPAEGDEGDDENDAEEPVGTTDEPEAAPPSATAVLTVNAFNGTLAFTLDLDGLDGPFAGTDGATLHLGVAGEEGPLALQLIGGEALDAAEEDVVTGVVFEADSAVRFADLLASPGQAYLQIATSAQPGGAVRGQLEQVSPAEAAAFG